MKPDTSSPRSAILGSGKIRRIIVKLGSGTLTDESLGLRERTIRSLAAQVARIRESRGIQVVVVTSGAIAAGRKKLGMVERPRTIALKQAAAAVGQTTLMRAYERAFEKRGIKVGQLLLTHEDFGNRERYLNAKNTLEALLSHGIVPIINENDTVATEEIRLGDNDHLAALVTQLIGADLLLLLTDSDGLYTRDPHRYPDARRIPLVVKVDEELVRSAGSIRGGSVGIGGMGSKLLAARLVSDWGTPVVIAGGLSGRSILDVLAGKDTGTLFLPRGTARARRRKLWIAHAMQSHGTITVDDGAKNVLMEGGKSLLPAGVVDVSGMFRKGDAVSICDRRGRVFARGITAWDSEQVERGKGRKSAEVRAILGEDIPAEMVHRDNLTILQGAR
ncbi:MAG: glutamate 5-kinase [Deltaproteobacteria bacterium]|nr:glutamate 5-kinase [Deltaproteobacteria bacterium]